MIEIVRDGARFAVKAAHDFSFLDRYGKVFRAFDRNDSGNISFGLEKEGERFFLKYAGAETVAGGVSPAEAVAILRRSMPLYEALRHPLLVELVSHGPEGAGYAALFRWARGECLNAYWDFGGATRDVDPRSPKLRFKRLPVETRVRALDGMYAFLAHVARRGYVAIDFYDGSVMYDFERDALRICDIDVFEKAPCINTMGRMWGSGRFMSPEEFQLGAAVDQISNVYMMGAAAFVYLGGELDRSRERWEAPDALYEVAARATRDDRAERYPSVDAYVEAWDAAK